LVFLVPQLLVTEYVMVAVPCDTPVTSPVPFTVATAVLLDDQLPPAVTLDKVVFDPAHTVVVPVIDATVGTSFTVTEAVLFVVPQVLVTEYVMVAVPAVIPATSPVPFTVATAVLLDDQLPPAVTLDKVVFDPAHTVVVPVIDATVGTSFTVTDAVLFVVPQVLVTEYVMVAIPCDTPVTSPVPFTVATAVLLVDQLPPAVTLDKVVFDPARTVVFPVMDA